MKIALFCFCILACGNRIIAQDSLLTRYDNAYNQIDGYLQKPSNGAFKKAVFLSENTYAQNQMQYESFNKHITDLAAIISQWMRYNPLQDYHFSDSIGFHKNLAIYKLLKDTIRLTAKNGQNYNLLPYGYDFNDFFGANDWGYMFVTKLLATHSGNCHSLPYLYKILADELEATCWLSLAPNHIYIKNRCKKIGWYNTELTSGSFPIDAWVMASGYMPLQSIQSKLYMDTLSNQQAIALCVLDLAKGYEHQTRNYYDGFILKCCNLVLQYHPQNPMALLLKAETLRQMYVRQKASKTVKPVVTFDEMQNAYATLFELGYREMPEKMYLQWLQSVTKEKEKYQNPQLKKIAGK
jgi:hypothetical protein